MKASGKFSTGSPIGRQTLFNVNTSNSNQDWKLVGWFVLNNPKSLFEKFIRAFRDVTIDSIDGRGWCLI
jgi:hypothetical protein